MSLTDDSQIIDELERVMPAIRQYFEHFRLEERLDLFIDPRPDLEPELAALSTRLELHPIFGRQELRWFGPAQLSLSPASQCRNLARMADARGAVASVQWLNHVYRSQVATVRFVVPITGLALEETHVLTDGVQLLPLRDLPSSPRCRMLKQAHYFTPRSRRVPFPPVVAIEELADLRASSQKS